MMSKRSSNRDEFEVTGNFNRPQTLRQNLFGSNLGLRRSAGKEAGADSITDRLINNKITWEGRWTRPVSSMTVQTAERKISTGERPSNQGRLSDYLPPSKHLVETMGKVFGGNSQEKDINFSSKGIRSSALGSSQRSVVKTLSQDRMTRSQHLHRIITPNAEPLLTQPILASSSKKFLNLLSSTQRDSNFRHQIQHMKNNFGKFMQRRKPHS